jgi:hypothetical protein
MTAFHDYQAYILTFWDPRMQSQTQFVSIQGNIRGIKAKCPWTVKILDVTLREPHTY